jgi:hypothetical protein
MNYSFIDKYTNNDFTFQGNLIFNYHNDDNSQVKNYNKFTNLDNKNIERNNWATESSIQKSLLKKYDI